MKMRTSPASHLPSTTFCWLPPLNSRTICVGGRLHAQLVGDRPGERRLAPPRQHAEPREPPAVRQRDVARHRQARHEALGLAILGKQADAARDRVGRAAEAHLGAVDEEPPVVAAGRRRQSRAPARVRPAPTQAGNAQHLAGVQRQADVGAARRRG